MPGGVPLGLYVNVRPETRSSVELLLSSASARLSIAAQVRSGFGCDVVEMWADDVRRFLDLVKRNELLTTRSASSSLRG